MSSAFLNLTSLLYLDVTPALHSDLLASPPTDDRPLAPAPGIPEEEVQARINAACLAERQQTEQRLAQQYEQQHTEHLAALDQGFAQRLASTLADFAAERSTYFAKVESEVVHLSLAIARKILEREAKTDPLLLAGLVRVALDGVESSSSVRLRVSADRLATWQSHLATTSVRQRPELLPDPSLSADECVLETEAGVARLNYEIQLKEIERGFLDLLGQRPGHHPDRTPTPASTA